jgi:O-antigen biosynthesis protein
MITKPFSRIKQKGFPSFFKFSIWYSKTILTKLVIHIAAMMGLPKYSNWVKLREPTEEILNQQKKTWQIYASQPLFTLIVAVRSDQLHELRWTLQSILAQTYPRWEALLLYSAKSDLQAIEKEVININNDPRINYTAFGAVDDHTNIYTQVLNNLSADFILKISPGDTLSANLFFELVTYINQSVETDIYYFDEDHYYQSPNNRLKPIFWPDWSPELLISRNFLAHAVSKRTLLIKGSLQKDISVFEDIILWASEYTSKIVHIPKILYHRQLPRKKGDSDSLEDEFHEERIKSHFHQIGVGKVTVSQKDNRTIHVTWPITGDKVSIIIPTSDHVKYLQRCVNSIMNKTAYPEYELILIENNSHGAETFQYYDALRNDPRVKIIEYSGQFNYNSINNLGAKKAEGNLILFLNNDIEVISTEWLEELVRWVEIPEVGVVGAKLLSPWHKIQHAGIVIGMEGHASHIFGGVPDNYSGNFGSVNWYRNYSAVTGACMIFRRNVFEKLGGFDENYTLVFSDIDICVRAIRQGYRVVYNPFVSLIHYEGKTRHHYIPENDMRIAFEKLKDIIARGDPYYNLNLTKAIREPLLCWRHEEAPLTRLKKIIEFL